MGETMKYGVEDDETLIKRAVMPYGHADEFGGTRGAGGAAPNNTTFSKDPNHYGGGEMVNHYGGAGAQGAPVTAPKPQKYDLNEGWLAYQRGDVKAEDAGAVRDSFSMDQDHWENYYRKLGYDENTDWKNMDTGELRRIQLQGLIDDGMVAEKDRAAALERLERSGGRWLYRRGSEGPWDPSKEYDSYDPDNQAMRDAEKNASDMGHEQVDSSDLSAKGWQNVDPALRNKITNYWKQTGIIPEAPPEQKAANSGNPPPPQQPKPIGTVPPPPSTPMPPSPVIEPGPGGVPTPAPGGGGGNAGGTAPGAGSTTQQRGDELYNLLMQKAAQTLATSRSDDAIRGQADAYGAAQERARRTAITEAAEGSGPYGNIDGVKRGLTERMGQNVGAFEANLIGQEMQAKRAEIMESLKGAQGMISDDKRLELEEKLKAIDAQIAREGHGVQKYGIDVDAAMKQKGIDLQKYGIDVNNEQFKSGLDQDWKKALMQNEQFLADFGLRKDMSESEKDLAMRRLGLEDWDRQMYWDLLQRGVL